MSLPIWIGAVLIFLLAVVVYWPALLGGFIWDDDAMVTRNPFVQAHNGLRYIWFSTGPVDYFPLTYTSLWLEWHLWGMKPLGYHVTNVLLHAANCAVLWRVLVSLKIPGAFLASLLFLVHPVNVESVAWIAERKNVLSMFFFMLTLWLYLRAGQEKTGKWEREKVEKGEADRTFYFLSLFAFVLALLSKTSVVMLPFILLLCDWWRRKNENLVTARNASGPSSHFSTFPLSHLLRLAPFFALALIMGVVTIWFQYNRAIAADVIHHRDFLTRLAGAACAVWFYLWKAIWPVTLAFVYDEWDIDSHSLVWYLPGLALVGIFILLGRFRQSWGRPALFALGCFVVVLFPILGFLKIYFQRYSYVADHWQYFSLPAVVALVAALVHRISPVVIQRLIAGILVTGLAILAWRQTAIYKSEESVWRDTLKKNPRCWLAWNELGLLMENNGRTDEAIRNYKRSFEIKPDEYEARNNLGALYYEEGRDDEAMELFQAALKLNPRIAVTHLNIGNVLDRRGQRAEAMAEYREALRLNPQYPEAHNNLACLLLLDGRPAEAIAHFQEALKWNPNYVDALSNLAGAHKEQGNLQKAIECAAAAVEMRRDYANTRFILGDVLLAAGKFSEAVTQYDFVLQLKPELTAAHFKKGVALMRLRRIDEAMNEFSIVLARDPNAAEAHFQMGMALSAKKNKVQALAHLREAARLNPNDPETLNSLAWMLATDPKTSFRDGVDAVRFAKRAVEMTQSKDAALLDTLAAACALTEQFSDAVKVAQQAEQVAMAGGQTNLALQIRRRAALFQRRVPYYEP